MLPGDVPGVQELVRHPQAEAREVHHVLEVVLEKLGAVPDAPVVVDVVAVLVAVLLGHAVPLPGVAARVRPVFGVGVLPGDCAGLAGMNY